MPVLQSQVLAMLQRVTSQYLSDTCTISREVTTTGEYGEPLHAWQIVSSGVACRVVQAGDQNRGAVRLEGQQDSIEDMYSIAVPAGTTLDVDYKVTIDAIDYYVVRIESALTDEVYRQAIVSRRR